MKKAVRFIASSNGGEGAVREIIEEILQEQRNYHDQLIDLWIVFLEAKVMEFSGVNNVK